VQIPLFPARLVYFSVVVASLPEELLSLRKNTVSLRNDIVPLLAEIVSLPAEIVSLDKNVSAGVIFIIELFIIRLGLRILSGRSRSIPVG
jgi:hypothetical protein